MTVTIPSIEYWFAGKRGKTLLQQEQRVLEHCLQACSGNSGLFLGPQPVLDNLAVADFRGHAWQGYSRRKTDGSIEFSGDQVSSTQRWSFEDESLDMIVLCHSLPLNGAREILTEAWRILAPEGQLLVSVMHDNECPLNLPAEILQQAMDGLPHPADSDRHYCGKLGLKWRLKTPQIINKFCPLRILQWQKHKPGMVGRLKFSLPKAGSTWEYT